MDTRKISFQDLAKAVHDAYEDLKGVDKGQPDPKYASYNPGKFGISVCLADGRRIDRGDVDAQFPLCGIGKLAVAVQLLQEMPIEDVVKKMGLATQGCGCQCQGTPLPQQLEALKGKGYHPMGLREISLVQPEGDPEGKWNNVVNLLISLMGSAPVLDDNLYKEELARAEKNGCIDALAKADFYLYDDATISMRLYNRLHSLLVTTAQLAQFGATIAADGVNPDTKEIVFDGALAPTLASMLAAKGPKEMAKPWLIMTGTPATCTKAGGFIAIVPGVMAIAAYSPALNAANIPVKAALSIKEILNHLQISALSSARVEFVD